MRNAGKEEREEERDGAGGGEADRMDGWMQKRMERRKGRGEEVISF